MGALPLAVARLAGMAWTVPNTLLGLVAGGVGTLVVKHATDVQCAELAAHGSDTNVTTEGAGRDVMLAPRPAWWPSADGDATALAFWRGAIAAVQWMADTVGR